MSICFSWLADRFDALADRFHTIAGSLRVGALVSFRPFKSAALLLIGAAIYVAFFGLLILSFIAGGPPQ